MGRQEEDDKSFHTAIGTTTSQTSMDVQSTMNTEEKIETEE